MFDFIKKFFAKSEEIVIEKVDPKDLEKWFEGKIVKLDQEMKEKLNSFRKELFEKLNSVRESIKKMEDASLRNPNVTAREMQFMEGNRKSYLYRTAHFLREIEEILEYELNFFLSHYKDYIDNFAKSTSRAYMILQEFFANEAAEIAAKIKEVDDHIKKMQGDESVHSYSRIETIKKEIIGIENKIKKRDDIGKEISKMKDWIAKLKGDKEELLKRRDEIIKSAEYKGLGNDEANKEKLEGETKKLKDKLYTDFSILGRPLRKYQRMAYQHDKLIEHYSTDALNALVTDFNLKIVDILKSLAKHIKGGKLGLKDKKTDKVLSQISRMDNKYFTDFVREYNGALKQKEELEKRISGSKVKEELDEVDNKIDKTKNKQSELKDKVSMLEMELNSINIQHLRDKLKENMGKVLKVKIEFV